MTPSRSCTPTCSATSSTTCPRTRAAHRVRGPRPGRGTGRRRGLRPRLRDGVPALARLGRVRHRPVTRHDRPGRADHPHLNFTEGTMKALPFPDGTLASALAWYSMIHLAPMELPDVFAEFDRVLAPGGHLLVAFQSTDGNVPEPFDHKVVRAHRWPIGRVAELAHRAGLAEVARLLRRPNENEHSPVPPPAPQELGLPAFEIPHVAVGGLTPPGPPRRNRRLPRCPWAETTRRPPPPRPRRPRRGRTERPCDPGTAPHHPRHSRKIQLARSRRPCRPLPCP